MNLWGDIIAKFKDISAITHDVTNYQWVHIVYQRKSESDKVDLVHVISEAIQEIPIQGNFSR